MWLRLTVVVSAAALSPLMVSPCGAADDAREISITAKKYEYAPSEITVKKGEQVKLKLTSSDRHHGFIITDLNIRADIEPEKVTEVVLTPSTVGDLEFHCDVFCGAGHEGMSGVIKVIE